MQALLTVILSDYHGIVPLNFVMVWRISYVSEDRRDTSEI